MLSVSDKSTGAEERVNIEMTDVGGSEKQLAEV